MTKAMGWMARAQARAAALGADVASRYARHRAEEPARAPRAAGFLQPAPLHRADVGDDVLEAVARRVEARLAESDSFRQALVLALQPPARRRTRRLLGPGLLLAAGYGANLAVKWFTGKSTVALLRARAAQRRHRSAAVRPPAPPAPPDLVVPAAAPTVSTPAPPGAPEAPLP